MPPLKMVHRNKQPSRIIGRQPMDLVKSEPSRDLKAYMENPLRMAYAVGYKDKPSTLSYSILYQMATKNSIVGAVINTRVNQISTFSRPARFADDNIGYTIRLRDPRKAPTDEERRIMHALELFLERCGFDRDNSRDDFDTFLRKLVRDSLIYDQMCFEIIPDRKGMPSVILPVDASTIRAATPLSDDDRFAPKGDDVRWVQIIDGQIRAEFTPEELAFCVRNPRTNINLQPYGFSELEQLITQVTSHLYAEEYNSKFFSQGGTTKGILNIKADPTGIGNREQLASFKRQWLAQVNGMTGAWKTPVLQIPDGIEYINVSQSNREMEFEKWMNYLVNIVCAIYQIDPAEVNFPNNAGVAGNGGSVFESSQEAKIKNSRDKGLKPLLRFIEATINRHIISRFSEDFVFCFTGINERTEEEKAELESKQVRVWKTINEIRKDHDMEPLENGDVILDASWINFNSTQSMMDDEGGMPEGMEEDEDEGDEYDDEYSYDEDDDDEDRLPPGYEDGDEFEGVDAEAGKKAYSFGKSQVVITIDDSPR